ncbi:MAG: ABC-F family ATP-binding cassette domain-containing protein [Thermoplasmatota archaeon]
MQHLIRADGITRSYGSTHVLEGASFIVQPGDKIALVGPNGSGKTTLFKLLLGQLKPDLGDFDTKADLRIAYLPQVPDVPGDTPVAELLAAPTARAQRLEAELAELEAWMADPAAWEAPDANDKMARYSELQQAAAEERSKGRATDSPLLNHLGVPPTVLEQTFGELSGGERSKVLLAKALAAAKETDVLLLDEPTNHLDIPTVEFVEEYLMDLEAAVIVSAHDKYLLDNVATRVFEVDHRRVASYTGNYSSYLAQRAAIQKALEAKKKRQFHEVKRQLAIIEELKRRNRFDAQVQSRKTRMKHIPEVTQSAPTRYKGFRLLFETDRLPREVLTVEDVQMRYGDRTLFDGVRFEVEGGEKLGIIGPNGCGKSTLIKLLIGKETPSAGEVKLGTNVKIGYFDQHHETLDPERELIDEIRSLRDPPPPDDWTRGLLGRFKFSGDAVFKKVKHLSGGERARLALAKFIADKHNVLVLDEPTNHLDLESQTIVAEALKAYEGTVLVVSHDRSFLDQVCNRIAVIAHGRVGVFTGNFSTAWTSKQLTKFTASGVQGSYKVRKAFKDWESGEKHLVGKTIEVTGVETQGFRRLLRWAEAEGYIVALD